MLQQTVVAAAIPYFERFVARLPDLPALADATEAQVLALWSGLGYYRRARNLHRAARAVVAEHNGVLPDDEAALRALPGVGPYTAAALAAIAFGKRTFALDGNAARVVARLTGVVAPIDRPATRDVLRATGQGWVPARRAGDFAQAVMELGATVCAPRVPACDGCPLATVCEAHRRGLTARIPAKSPRPPKRIVHMVSVRLRRAGRVLLVRQATGLLAGTWMLPSLIVTDARPADDLARAAARAVGMAPGRVIHAGGIRHLFTHRDIAVDVFDVTRARSTEPTETAAQAAETVWADEDRLDHLAVSSFLRKQLALKRDKSAESP